MNPDVQKAASLLNHQVGEFMDGHVIIGFMRGTDCPVVMFNARTPKVAHALNNMLNNLVSIGGVGCTGHKSEQVG